MKSLYKRNIKKNWKNDHYFGNSTKAKKRVRRALKKKAMREMFE